MKLWPDVRDVAVEPERIAPERSWRIAHLRSRSGRIGHRNIAGS
jgi:hypothetical protein